jgi:hypothetical protein
MDAADHTQVLERLLELEGWAEYIFEALHLDQDMEPATREMIESVVEKQALRQLRELSWSLRDKLHLITTTLELTRAEQPVTAGAHR